MRKGDLAFALAGYSVTAIDPLAPEGSIFRRVGIEEFSEPGPFDHVVAILSPDNGIESVVLGTNWPSSEGPPVTKLAQRRTAARSYAPTCDTLTVPWRSMPP